jgi:hypothetical protein
MERREPGVGCARGIAPTVEVTALTCGDSAGGGRLVTSSRPQPETKPRRTTTRRGRASITTADGATIRRRRMCAIRNGTRRVPPGMERGGGRHLRHEDPRLTASSWRIRSRMRVSSLPRASRALPVDRAHGSGTTRLPTRSEPCAQTACRVPAATRVPIEAFGSPDHPPFWAHYVLDGRHRVAASLGQQRVQKGAAIQPRLGRLVTLTACCVGSRSDRLISFFGHDEMERVAESI